ncbi:MAG: GIY-YIG nuclease family protein [Anaerolineae bacterium]
MSPPHFVCQVNAPAQPDALPAAPGVYALRLNLHTPCQVFVAGRGVSLPAGDYIYVGSARGTGGLRARLGRHLSGSGRPHWHVDALRGHAQFSGAYYCVAAVPLECQWVRALLTLPGVSAPAPGFGASDCRAGCPAHLLLSVAPPADVYAALESAAPRFAQ